MLLPRPPLNKINKYKTEGVAQLKKYTKAWKLLCKL